MPNKNGSVYGLTILSPIIDDEKATPSHDLQIRDYLAKLSTRQDSPFAISPGTHLARLVVMDDVIYVGMPACEEHLKSKYLVFESNCDGELDDYLAGLAASIPDHLDAIWSHCVGYPGAANREAFIRYMKACQLTTTFYFAAVNDKTVPETLRALQTQAAVADFIADHQGMDPSTLQREFIRFATGLKSLPTPKPGSGKDGLKYAEALARPTKLASSTESIGIVRPSLRDLLPPAVGNAPHIPEISLDVPQVSKHKPDRINTFYRDLDDSLFESSTASADATEPAMGAEAVGGSADDGRASAPTADPPFAAVPAASPAAPSPPLMQTAGGTPETPLTNATLTRIFYATDRLESPSLEGGVQYGEQRSARGVLHYGSCEISIPKVHKLGRLETPSILRLEFRPNPKRHILLTKTKSLQEQEFFEQVKTAVTKSHARDAFVFIHGYNVSFEDAARRTGQIAFDLDFVGAPVLYSWPSNGRVADYAKDETNVNWSTPHFERFLTLLSQYSGADRVHIIAHSMGNRVVCDALKVLSYNPSNLVRFSQLVLAAPDIDAETFQELAATLQRLSSRITMYASSKDKALYASKFLHGNPRAGEPLLVIAGLDTIDASSIDTDFLGHSYYSDSWPLLSDIHSILFDDKPPNGRFGLTPREHKDGRYFAFKA